MHTFTWFIGTDVKIACSVNKIHTNTDVMSEISLTQGSTSASKPLTSVFLVKNFVCVFSLLKYLIAIHNRSVVSSVFISGGFRISQTGAGGCQPQVWVENLLFGKIFTENCMKMKVMPPEGGVPNTPLHPPMIFVVSSVLFINIIWEVAKKMHRVIHVRLRVQFNAPKHRHGVLQIKPQRIFSLH